MSQAALERAPWEVDAEAIRAARPRHLLFLCVANSARSQMAEGIARALAPPSVRVSSAGSRPTAVNPLAVKALAEIGIDLRGHASKSVDDVPPDDVDVVVTLCAEEVCPVFMGKALRVHWALPDPAAVSDEAERLQAFRRVRDELRRRLVSVFAPQDAGSPEPVRYGLASVDELPALSALVARLRLPTADLGRENQTFLVARDGTGIVGCVGIEQVGEYALFRSFAVLPRRQGEGIGTELHRRALDEAVRRGTRAVFALTTTAEDFCARAGYARIDRAEVPDAVRASPEFRTCCPASAACMRLVLR